MLGDDPWESVANFMILRLRARKKKKTGGMMILGKGIRGGPLDTLPLLTYN